LFLDHVFLCCGQTLSLLAVLVIARSLQTETASPPSAELYKFLSLPSLQDFLIVTKNLFTIMIGNALIV
jgi:hypothetical protein